MILLTLAISCRTLQVKGNQTEQVSPPNPYTEEGELILNYDENTDCVIIPMWWWRNLMNYLIVVAAEN